MRMIMLFLVVAFWIASFIAKNALQLLPLVVFLSFMAVTLNPPQIIVKRTGKFLASLITMATFLLVSALLYALLIAVNETFINNGKKAAVHKTPSHPSPQAKQEPDTTGDSSPPSQVNTSAVRSVDSSQSFPSKCLKVEEMQVLRSPFTVNGLRLGMSEGETKDILGEPDRIEETQFARLSAPVFVWEEGEFVVRAQFGFGQSTEHVSVIEGTHWIHNGITYLKLGDSRDRLSKILGSKSIDESGMFADSDIDEAIDYTFFFDDDGDIRKITAAWQEPRAHNQ